MNHDLRRRLLDRWSALKTERSSWWSHYQELSKFLLPRSGKFFAEDRNRGGKRHQNIYDNTATRSVSVLASGLIAGATSPARPWFRLRTPDPDLNKQHTVRAWLDDVTTRMLRVFSRSNTYRALHQLYEELGVYGTAATFVVPNFNTVIHHHPLTCGEYAIASDSLGNVSSIYREFTMTVSQMVREFGYEKCSMAVRQQFDRGNLEQGFTVLHAVEPRHDRNPWKDDVLNMPWRSVYLEPGDGNSGVLRETGFRRFPALVPRWVVRSNDTYGQSPGMMALGDVKSLQHKQVRVSQTIDKKLDPPLVLPTHVKNLEVDSQPGGRNYADAATPQAGVRSMFEVNLDPRDLRELIYEDQMRIKQAFHEDLFLMLANNTDARKTATEVAELHEEKLLMLGPVLERLHNELLSPLIDMTFDAMLEAGILPPAPPELQGMDLQPEFVSMLAQAQRAIGVNAIDRLIGNVTAVMPARPELGDKIDWDEWVERTADDLGVPAELIVPQDEVVELRAARNAAMAAKEQAALMQTQAATVKDLASAPTGGQTALNDVMGMFSGYSSPTPPEVR